MTYKIIRYYMKGDNEVIMTGLTLEQAQAHCNDPQTSSRTATNDEGHRRSRKKGPWFDGYTKEK